MSFFGGADGHIGKFDLVWALKNKKLAFPKYLVLLDDLDQDKIDQLESGLSLKWSTKTGHRVRVFSSIDF
ncbi:hypothetical protein ACSKF4_004825, partial [Escherichia coli]